MAKKATVVHNAIDHNVLKNIVDATKAGSFVYVSPMASQPMTSHNPPLVEVNTAMVDPEDNTKFATRATPHAEVHLASLAAAPAAAAGETSAPKFEILTGATLPPSKKRGGSSAGAPTIYPFADLPIGGSFFVPGTEKHPDPVKTLGSTVSAQNRKYAIETGQFKTVTRAKRDEKNKALLDAAGNKITETVSLPVLKYERKFVIRGVKAGEVYGAFTAPVDGALIFRVPVED